MDSNGDLLMRYKQWNNDYVLTISQLRSGLNLPCITGSAGCDIDRHELTLTNEGVLKKKTIWINGNYDEWLISPTDPFVTCKVNDDITSYTGCISTLLSCPDK